MECSTKKKKFDTFTWVDICESNAAHVDRIAKEYKLNYLQVVDSLQKGHLPKLEKSGEYNFLILRAFTASKSGRATTINEISSKIAFFYKDTELITIHRSSFSFLEQIQNQYASPEELLIFIISKMIESFAEPSNILANKVDELEETIFLKDYTKISLEALYFQKSKTRITKKLLQITQGIINQIDVKEHSQPELQDVKDKLLNLILNYDEVLEDSNNLLHTYLSVNSQKSNDVMKLLTIFSAFFLPLTFIAGVYGMNFNNIPELKWDAGYYLSLGGMVVIAIIIYFWFKRKKIL